jgi:hypothetical protein
MNSFTRVFRKYHRRLAIIMCLPLLITVLTGISYPILGDWLHLDNLAGFILQVHSGSIFGLEAVYPVLNGLGLAGLLVTGMSMTNLFRR